MSTKTIPLGAVRVALTGALIKSQSPQMRARTAAMTSYAPLARCCGSHRPHVEAKTVHFGVMENGELRSLIKRVQLEQGVAEVRKTWGQGVKALLADVGTGVMR
ncbi:hypothetical protein [Comamonas fluminis]|uniref:hypothetical protein n=1 Tax=Comamonas fluminis TaxID=2796366 RepID=UPI001C497AAA|nr:hypothetical protein [Comamonas fluminis]